MLFRSEESAGRVVSCRRGRVVSSYWGSCRRGDDVGMVTEGNKSGRGGWKRRMRSPNALASFSGDNNAPIGGVHGHTTRLFGQKVEFDECELIGVERLVQL